MDAFSPERQRRIDQLRREQNPGKYDYQPQPLHIRRGPPPERPQPAPTPDTERGVHIIQM